MSVFNGTAHSYCLPTKGGVQHHLHAGVETIHVAVQDRPVLHAAHLLRHPVDLS